MARPLRIEYPGAYYHVTCRGNERRRIFLDRADYGIFLEKLSLSLDIYHVLLHAYICMDNHFHLLLCTVEGNLSEFMRHFNISYTAAFNRRHKRVGHLYQGRYKAYLIEADNYLLTVSRYIHLNPVRVKSVKGRLIGEKWEILERHEWSSLPEYLLCRKRREDVDCGTVLNYMGGDTKEGRERYRRFVEWGMERETGNPLEAGKGHGIVGGREFIDRMRERFGAGEESAREKPALRELRKRVPPGELLDRYARATGIDRAELCGRRIRSLERAMLMELLYRYCDSSQVEIGMHMGGIDYSAVSNARRRLHERWEKGGKQRDGFEKLIAALKLK